LGKWPKRSPQVQERKRKFQNKTPKEGNVPNELKEGRVSVPVCTEQVSVSEVRCKVK